MTKQEFKALYPELYKRAKKVSQLLEAKLTTKRPNGSYGGYEDYETKVYITIRKDIPKAYLITTCGCCGSSRWETIK